jgi:putative tryptophan/tyrosine transport system substrate-binding protein
MQYNFVEVVLALGALLSILCTFATAQQPTRIPRIGFLSVSPVGSVRTEAFRQGLRDLGYMEGGNIIVEWRSGDGSSERTAALAAELLRLKVDLIVTGGAGATRPAKAATKTVPIVMALDNDPVGSIAVQNNLDFESRITKNNGLGRVKGVCRLRLSIVCCPTP